MQPHNIYLKLTLCNHTGLYFFAGKSASFKGIQASSKVSEPAQPQPDRHTRERPEITRYSPAKGYPGLRYPFGDDHRNFDLVCTAHLTLRRNLLSLDLHVLSALVIIVTNSVLEGSLQTSRDLKKSLDYLYSSFDCTFKPVFAVQCNQTKAHVHISTSLKQP